MTRPSDQSLLLAAPMAVGVPMASVICPFCGKPGARAGAACAACGRARPAARLPSERMDVRAVAKRQRVVIWLVLGMLVSQLLMFTARGQLGPAISLGAVSFYLGTLVCAGIYLIMLMNAMRYGLLMVVLCVVLLLLPCLNLLTLLAINGHATRVLREAGLRVGFMGVRDEDVVRKLDPRLCATCGYDLTGNTSGVCPECGTPNPNVAPIAPPI